MTLPRPLILLACAALAPACAPERGAAYERAFAEASRAEGAGRFAEAAASYDEATHAAVRVRDRDQARWDAAEMVARTGNFTEALSRLDVIASVGGAEHQAEAAYRAANLRIRYGDAARGWMAMEQIPSRFPQHGVAHVAVRRLVARADQADAADPKSQHAAREELAALEHDLGDTELGPLIAYLSAQHLEEAGDDAGALAAYLRIAESLALSVRRVLRRLALAGELSRREARATAVGCG